MGSTTVRLDETTRDALRRLAEQTGQPMSAVLEQAIECYRRQHLLDETNAAFAALRQDDAAWQEELDERRAWDATTADDLQDKGRPNR
jgi:predicted transcriptional regulator